MYQKWRELLFLHWGFEPAEIQKTLPPGLSVDTYEGRAYVGIVPFFMRDVRPRYLPALPGVSHFQELNLRTYVYDESGLPGVWFYSLDAAGWLAVQAARLTFGLPYYYAAMSAEREADGAVAYRSRRRGADPGLESTFRYRPLDLLPEAEPGSLNFFLVERYLLYSPPRRNGRFPTGRVYHRPYPLQEVEVSAWDANLFALEGLPRPERPPDHAVMSPGVDVEVFPLKSYPFGQSSPS